MLLSGLVGGGLVLLGALSVVIGRALRNRANRKAKELFASQWYEQYHDRVRPKLDNIRDEANALNKRVAVLERKTHNIPEFAEVELVKQVSLSDKVANKVVKRLRNRK